ncbi:MAG: tetratricopeptide repeat protein [Ignavibacteriaceae bacterium]
MGFSILKKIRFSFFLLLLVVVTGCSVWNSFTTYFNLYYNTTESFEKAEEQIYAQQRSMFSTQSLTVPGTANTELDKVIEKCSNILQFHSETGYVEDALLMLGKSFYYQNNYQKAQRKFEELVASQVESDYELEAELWIGKCQMKLKNYNDALSTLHNVRQEAIEEDEELIVQEAFIEEIIYRVTTEDYNGAIALANEFMEVSDDDEIKAEVWYEIGNLNIIIEDVQNAILAYNNVFEFSPGFDLETDARLKYGQALRDGEQSETALSVFDDMRSKDKYENKVAEVDFEIGKTYASLERYDNAIDQLIMVDSTYRNTESSGAAKYEIGMIYESGLKQLDSAAVYYKKASTSSLPQAYLIPVREKNQLFTRYINLRNNLNNYDKQFFYSEHPDEFIKDSTRYVEDSLAIAEEIASVKELQDIWAGLDSMWVVEDTTGAFQDTLKTLDSLIIRDTTFTYRNRDTLYAQLNDTLYSDSAIVFVFDSLFSDPSMLTLVERRQYEMENRQKEQRAKELAAELPDSLRFENNPPRRPTISKDSLKTVIVKNQLQLGNLFLAELNIPDSAYWYYNSTLITYPNTTYHANTLYAMGSYYLTVDNKKKADSLFNIIYVNYKNERVVNAAANKLNKPLIDLDYDPAEEKYLEAESLMLLEDYAGAINGFYNVHKTYPGSPFAPKALYTCGWILENELFLLDSAATYYDSLIVNYPSSEYVRIIAPKVTMYKQELRRRELALQDSLYTLENGLDSLATDSALVQIEKTYKDTIEVAFDDGTENGIKQDEQVTTETSEIPVIKEPVWNPRRRR